MWMNFSFDDSVLVGEKKIQLRTGEGVRVTKNQTLWMLLKQVNSLALELNNVEPAIWWNFKYQMNL